MEKLTEIYNELSDAGVMFFTGSYSNMPDDCDAVAIKYHDTYGVFLDIDKVRTLAQEKETVSHEWAHIKTDATYHMDAPSAVRRRAEVRAIRAQIKKVLPWEDLYAAVHDCRAETIYDLAEFFNLTEAFVAAAIAYYTEICGKSF